MSSLLVATARTGGAGQLLPGEAHRPVCFFKTEKLRFCLTMVPVYVGLFKL